MIEELIQQFATKLPPSAGDNLLGFAMDLDHALWQAKKTVIAGKVARTAQPAQLLVAQATIAKKVKALPEVLLALKSIWASVAYRYFEASSVQYYQNAMVLRFVTVIQAERFFVSGSIILQGPRCEELLAEHQSKFGEIC